MEENQLPDGKLFELALDVKSKTETRRDEINKYYPSIFSATLIIMPLLDQYNKNTEIINKVGHWFSIKIVLILLSIIGIVISFSWVSTLKRIYGYLEALDNLLIEIEQRNHKQFISYINKLLIKTHAPKRVTKQVIILPYVFLIIFTASLLFLLFQ